jgi:hypothetical protein
LAVWYALFLTKIAERLRSGKTVPPFKRWRVRHCFERNGISSKSIFHQTVLCRQARQAVFPPFLTLQKVVSPPRLERQMFNIISLFSCG